ncbi:unnamed protein product [Effrenium voratum]|nr:unnamed protein product [Effrenium voratum]
MDPLTDCPVCFETYEEEPEGERPPPVGRHWAVKLDCCQQSLCCHCQVCLARCPFCRTRWHPEEDNGDGEHFWQRRSFPNPILTVWGTTLAFDAIRVMASAGISGVRTLAAAAAATAAEASPVVIAGGAAGAVALAGTMALYQASQHRPQHAANLAAQVQSRGRHRLVLLDEGSGSAWSKLVCRLWDAVQWHILPMWDGMPHVYTGSPWRNEGRMRHRQRLHELVNGESRAAGSEEDSRFAEKRLWGDLAFCFMLWLDYNPHTPNWGSCISYGLPPMHLCWHNRWREDMRHVVSDFARYLHSDYIQEAVPEKQRSCARASDVFVTLQPGRALQQPRSFRPVLIVTLVSPACQICWVQSVGFVDQLPPRARRMGGALRNFRPAPPEQRLPGEAHRGELSPPVGIGLAQLPNRAPPGCGAKVPGYSWHARKAGSHGNVFGANQVVLRVPDIDVLVLRGLQEIGMHPNLLAVLDLFRDSGAVWLVTQLCPGGTLAEAVALRQQWSSPQLAKSFTGGFEVGLAMAWTAQLFAALSFLHEHRVIHRSVKPESCILDQPRIVDSNLVLGNFSQSSRLYLDNIMVDRPEELLNGSAGYVAPELKRQAMSSTAVPLEIKSDCWSGGCVLYFMLEGKAAFNYSEFPKRAEKGQYTAPLAPKEICSFLATLLQVDYVARAEAHDALREARRLAGRFQLRGGDSPRSPQSRVDLS